MLVGARTRHLQPHAQTSEILLFSLTFEIARSTRHPQPHPKTFENPKFSSIFGGGEKHPAPQTPLPNYKNQHVSFDFCGGGKPSTPLQTMAWIFEIGRSTRHPPPPTPLQKTIGFLTVALILVVGGNSRHPHPHSKLLWAHCHKNARATSAQPTCTTSFRIPMRFVKLLPVQ